MDIIIILILLIILLNMPCISGGEYFTEIYDNED